MKRIQPVLFLICLFLATMSITTLADAIGIQVISQHGKWTVQSDCTSVYAISSPTSDSEGFRAGLTISFINGYGRPKIHVSYWSDDFKSHPKLQFKFMLADNDLTSYGWICEKNACAPENVDSAAQIIEKLLANEDPFSIIITDQNKTIRATVDTTGINEAYQTLLKRRR